MLLGAGLFLAFLVTTNAESPRSPVRAVISDDSTAPLPDLIKALDAAGRTEALARLDRLDRGPLDDAALAELREAYRLLGRSEDARDGGGSAGDAQNIFSLARSGKYAAAQAAAERGLERFPGDKNLLALLHQVKGRTAGIASPAFKGPPPSPRGEASRPDVRPSVLAVTIPKGSIPVPRPSLDETPLQYVSEAAHPLTLRERIWGKALLVYALIDRRQDARDLADQARLRAALDASDTGRSLVAELGGWTEIDKTVDVRMAKLAPGLSGMAIPLNGYRHKLYISRKLSSETDAVAAAAFAHELSHIADFRRGEGGGGLAMPSEFAAHRVQVRVFLELKRGMSEESKKKEDGVYLWEYSNFIEDLWKDHIPARFPTREKFMSRYAHKSVATMASDAYSDLRTSRVLPGSPQLDHHLNDPERGMYSMRTDETDILNVVKNKKAKGVEPTTEQSESLIRRNKMILRMNVTDDAYRLEHGFDLADKP